MGEIIEHIPIITTLFSIYFLREIYSHYLFRKKAYLLWWSIGVLTFGLGTLSESINVVFGWNGINLRYWYIVGALLGGFPLAQGTVYLLMKKRFADLSSLIVVSVIIIASVFVILTPISIPEGFDYKLTGAVFQWKWVRLFSPLINLYAFVFLVGGAIYSAIKYKKQVNKEPRYKGNVYIAIGGLLPGIGGSFTRFGYVNALFITELLGLILIYTGYRIIKLDKHKGR
ncbi:MAG: hypothetical protein GXO88_14725 [Chlorobi bacterium]|nr:hypothetical protein [Chlorobiota bacterium]